MFRWFVKVSKLVLRPNKTQFERLRTIPIIYLEYKSKTINEAKQNNQQPATTVKQEPTTQEQKKKKN